MASSIPGRSYTFMEIDNEPILQSFSSLPLIHSISAVVICTQSTNRFFKLAQENRTCFGVEHFIIVLMNRLYKTRVCSFLYCGFTLFLKTPYPHPTTTLGDGIKRLKCNFFRTWLCCISNLRESRTTLI